MRWLVPMARSMGHAIRFLTLLPVPRLPGATAEDLAGSLHLFPLVGLLVGSVSVAAGLAAQHLFDAPVHAVVAVTASAIVTAGFHLDGLADTCDAIFSWRDREKQLEIMKDSRIGAMGAISLVLVIALKISALLALAKWWWVGALISPAFGRWADVYGVTRFPAAKNEGLASKVAVDLPGGQLSMATILVLVIVTPLFYWGHWYTVLACLGVAWGSIHFVAAAMSRSLGGLTGDTYGALCEIGEVAALLSVCVILT